MKLARHTLYNLLGLGAPLLVAVVTIPELYRGLGAERFGLLTLIWAVTSYFGLFDFGLGRALTQSLAVVLARDSHAGVAPLTRTALGLMLVLGVVGGGLLMVLAPQGVALLSGVPDPQDAVQATRWMAVVLPFITLTTGLRGALEACHAFGWVNAIRLPMGLWTFLGPWLVLVFRGPELASMTAVLALGRVVAWAAHAWALRRELPAARTLGPWSRDWLGQLLRAGGWLTVSNVISPLMGYLDRFLIGTLVSAAAVAHYATPYELVTKLWIVPGALVAVLMPRFAARGLADWPLQQQAVAALFWVLLPVCAALAWWADPLLSLWLGAELAAPSAPLLQGFAFGILVNCLAHVPLTWLQAQGEYRQPALLHAAELPFFVLALVTLIPLYGLAGALVAWLLRMAVDTAGLFILAARQAQQRWVFPFTGLAVLTGAVAVLTLPAGAVREGVAALAWLGLVTMAALRLKVLWLRRPAEAIR